MVPLAAVGASGVAGVGAGESSLAQPVAARSKEAARIAVMRVCSGLGIVFSFKGSCSSIACFPRNAWTGQSSLHL